MHATTEAAKGLLVATKVLRDPCLTFVYTFQIIIFLSSRWVIYLSTNRPLKLQTTLNYLSNGKSQQIGIVFFHFEAEFLVS